MNTSSKTGSSTKKHLGNSIEERPEGINDCSENDSVLGLKTAEEPSILTLVERKTRSALTVYLAGKAEYVNQAVAELSNQYLIKTITPEELEVATSAINQRPRRIIQY